MNAIDAPYEVDEAPANVATSSAPQAPQTSSTSQQPTLEDDFNQVLGSLGRLWGGVRRSGQSALETARKDLGSVVTQAQRELNKLGAEAQRAFVAPETPTPSSTAEATNETDNDVKAEGSGSAESADDASQRTPTASAPPQSQSFFGLDLSQTLSTFQHQLTAAQGTFQQQLSVAQDQFQHRLHIAQDQFQHQLHAAQTQLAKAGEAAAPIAEEWGLRSEALLKEAGNLLKDAVKVVPPDEAGRDSISWDGMDSWTAIAAPGEPDMFTAGGASGSSAARRVGGNRTAALLKGLRYNPAVLRMDPSADEAYTLFVAEQIDAKGGIDGDEWSLKIKELIENEDEDSVAFKTTRDTLVPAELTSQQFWSRYFYRVHQIEQEEEKRKALLAAQSQTDELFSWEEDEDDDSKPSATTSSSTPTIKPPPSANAGTTSPGESGSQDSYDVVSGVSSPSAVKSIPASDDAEGDSDWE